MDAPQPAARTVVLAVTGMHCASCGLLIDDCLLDVDGVLQARTDLRAERTTVTASASVSDAVLLAAVAEAGYAASVIDG